MAEVEQIKEVSMMLARNALALNFRLKGGSRLGAQLQPLLDEDIDPKGY